MNKLIELVKTPEFLFGTILAGLLTNILSHYLVKRFDVLISKLSKKFATMTQAARDKRERNIQLFVEDKSERQFFMQYIIFRRIMAIYDFSFIVACIVALSWIPQGIHANLAEPATAILVFFWVLFWVLALSSALVQLTAKLWETERISEEIFEARNREMKQRQIRNG